MHVGKAGFAPLLRMRSSTSSATSSNNAPSSTRATARSRASREIRPARSNDSRTSASMRLRSRTNWTLPKDLGARTGEVHDRRSSAWQGRAAINDRNRDGQVPGSRLRRVELLDRPGLERIRREAVYGVRRMNHEATGPQDVADAPQCRRVQEILRTQGQRNDRLDHGAAERWVA